MFIDHIIPYLKHFSVAKNIIKSLLNSLIYKKYITIMIRLDTMTTNLIRDIFDACDIKK